MKALLVLVSAALLVGAAPLAAQSVPLPSGAENLLKQLEAFELETRAAAEKAIAEKRRLVAQALQPHLDRETKEGRLEAAVWLKAKIAEISGVDAQPNPSAVNGTTWKNGSWTYHFLNDGVVEVKAPTGQNRYRWAQDGESVEIHTAEGSKFAVWKISRSGDAARVTWGTGDGMEPKKQAAP